LDEATKSLERQRALLQEHRKTINELENVKPFKDTGVELGDITAQTIEQQKEEWQAAQDAAVALQKEVDDLTKQLEFQRETFGFTADEIERYKLAMKGAKEEDLERIKILQEENAMRQWQEDHRFQVRDLERRAAEEAGRARQTVTGGALASGSIEQQLGLKASRIEEKQLLTMEDVKKATMKTADNSLDIVRNLRVR
jgi:hypothetical protein